jgi:sterol desaturase/sphingolipid hydroxylase (fatty acid hydroxylase superfamily)
MVILLKILLTFVFSFFLTTLLGYVAHWILHQSWSGRLYEAHRTHHFILFPPEDFYSDTYRDAGIDDSGKFFIALFSPLLLLILALGWFGVYPLWMGFLIVGEMGVIGYMHDLLHEKLHLTKTWWKQFGWFQEWTRLHITHHQDVSKNLGIFSFWVDRVMGTFKKDK